MGNLRKKAVFRIIQKIAWFFIFHWFSGEKFYKLLGAVNNYFMNVLSVDECPVPIQSLSNISLFILAPNNVMFRSESNVNRIRNGRHEPQYYIFSSSVLSCSNLSQGRYHFHRFISCMRFQLEFVQWLCAECELNVASNKLKRFTEHETIRLLLRENSWTGISRLRLRTVWRANEKVNHRSVHAQC